MIEQKIEKTKTGIRKVYVEVQRKFSKRAGKKKQAILEAYSTAKQLNILRKALLSKDPKKDKDLIAMDKALDTILK